MNILISILNESCGDAKSNAEENAKELEMASFMRSVQWKISTREVIGLSLICFAMR